MTDKVEAKIIAAKIKEAREERGWDIPTLALRAHLRASHIQKIENGDYCISIDVLNKLAKALNITITFPLN